MPVFSILMTTYECRGHGPRMTRKHLESIFAQTYRPIQCVVSDHSKNSEIEDLVESMNSAGVDVVYTRHSQDYGSIASNMNNSLKYASGDYIQHVSMDDWYHDPTAVGRLVEFMDADPSIKWAILPCWQYPQNTVYRPRWLPNFNFNINTIGGPPSVVIRSTLQNICFDKRINICNDLVWFFNLYTAAGRPHVYTGAPIYANHSHELQVQVTCSEDSKEKELKIILEEYGSLTKYTP